MRNMTVDPTKKAEIKSHFVTREGLYKQHPSSEFCRPNRTPLNVEGPPSSITPVKVSFVEIDDWKRICFTIGRELFYYTFDDAKKPVDLTKPLDKRTYKGVAPTCHHINNYAATEASVLVAVGFAAGQVQIIDVGAKESLQILNEERMVESSRTTCVRWLPGNNQLLLASHTNGHIYCYDTSKDNRNVTPYYHDKPHKVTDGVKMFTTKSKQYTIAQGQVETFQPNPLFKLHVTHDNSAIHQFEFSNDGNFVAIVTQEGYLRVLDYANCESKGSMKSYFGGLLCCAWSPDDRYIVTGGEDDLVTVWSFHDQVIIARGYGHKSWVSDIAFDSYNCIVPNEIEFNRWFGNNAKKSQENQPKTQNKKHGFLASKVIKSLTSNDKTEAENNDGASQNGSFAELNGRLSITSASMTSLPNIIYRFGSVGQDAQLCLWELTADALYSRRRTGTVLGGFGSMHGKVHRPRSGQQTRDVESSEGVRNTEWATNTLQYKATNETTQENEPMHRHNIFSHLSSKSETNAIAPITSGKFATLGTREQKKEPREHKRNLSLPHFYSSKGSASDVSKHEHSKKKEDVEANVFGTNLCPHLEDTIMLEPLVCKRISHSRLTSISFHKHTFVISSQEGFIQTWLRPIQCENSNL